ncbi:MAG: FecR domain-containing protein [Bacteroidetes bacterium]|nr:FecR domain-containing protein [Bacteroidota bacterium]
METNKKPDYDLEGLKLTGETGDGGTADAELQKIWNLSAGYKHEESASDNEAWARLRSRMTEEAPVRVAAKPRRMWYAAAAVAACAVAGAGIWLSQSGKQALEPARTEVAGANEIKTIHLPDGSSVVLNSNSKITIAEGFGVGSRLVSLTGEARFEIAPDKAHPFRVVAGNSNVQVLGTGFDLQAYEGETVQILVRHGKVQFSSGNGNVVLTRGMAARSIADGGVQQVMADSAVQWQTGMLVFRGATLEAVSKALQHRYGKKLKYMPMDANREFTGKFKPGTSSEEILETLKLALKLPLIYE